MKNSKSNFLIVDDSIGMRNLLKSILKNGGYQVIGEAEDGDEAFEKYKNMKPDFVTLDITMPKLQGLETLKKIITYDKEAVIIMVSAVSEKSSVLKAIDLGAKHYILKPLKPEKVLAVIDEVKSLLL